jgi:hypothetical protein
VKVSILSNGASRPPASGDAKAPVRQARPPLPGQLRIAIIRNPRSHGNRARSGMEAGGSLPGHSDIVLETIEPSGREAIGAELSQLAADRLDGLVIDGGDGTVRDVLTAGLPIFGADWPPIAVLPRGKTNALASDLGLPPRWSLADALAAFATRCTAERRPMSVRLLGEKGGSGAVGFILGAGAFTIGTQAAQQAHRYGAFGGFAVGLTVAWSVSQILFGTRRNRWRRGTRMEVRLLPEGEELEHGDGDSGRRRSLLVATTLERFPLGLKPFGPPDKGFKLMAIDRPHRRIFLAAPLILAGRRPRWLRRLGLHQRTSAGGITLDLDANFILDGEACPPGSYRVEPGPKLAFVVP